jgi:hypothetical protein
MRTAPALPALTGLCTAVLAMLEPCAHGRAVDTVRQAAVLPVTSCDDSGPGTLRATVAIAASGDTIDLSQLPCSDSTITLTSGAIAVSIGDLTISGVPLARPEQADGVTTGAIIDGDARDRVFDHSGTGALMLFGLTVRNGAVDGPGGCVRSSGDVALLSSVVSGCTVDATQFGEGLGGGLFVEGALYMSDSRISGNSVSGYSFVCGGGLFVSGMLTMKHSTLSDNSAIATSGAFGLGGGLYAGAAVAISYSTISANTATDIGGAELLGANGAALSVANTTISGNHGGGVGGLLALQAPLHMASSTIAFNTSTGAIGGTGGLAIGNPSQIESSIIANNASPDGASDLHAQCGIGGSCDTIVATGSNNLILAAELTVPADTLTDDPHLQPLANNGGPTKTHALASGSPAIDHGNANGTGSGCLPYDQRGPGYARSAGAEVDIGAFELGAGPDRIFTNGFDLESLADAVARPTVCP